MAVTPKPWSCTRSPWLWSPQSSHSSTVRGLLPRGDLLGFPCPGTGRHSILQGRYVNPGPSILCVWFGGGGVTVQSLSRVRLFVTPWTAAGQASLSFTTSRSLLKLMSVESVMPTNHLILCRPFLLLPSIFPSIRVFSDESALRIRWPEYWCFIFSISPSTESVWCGLFSFSSSF